MPSHAPFSQPLPPPSSRRKAPGGADAPRALADELVVPLAVEEVSVDKVVEPIERVRAQTRVTEHELDVETEVVREMIDVEHVPVGQFVEEPPQVRVEGDTTIVPVVEEVAFVRKRLLLREEVRLTKRRVVEPRTAKVPVREEHVHVERLPADPAARRKS